MINTLPENEYELELLEADDPTVEEDNELFISSLLLSPDEDEEFEDHVESVIEQNEFKSIKKLKFLKK